ncbi:hypothetical protein HV819_00090 [Anaerococcus sp. AGMB00486]|uniref:ABC-type glycine betaine transport system substrate-binding domain-containing protein n=1 Tax=Anaerococcus faecalis TaxID=2742993 RepID=A0ABX2N6W1_9FIRM|nr:hypothetical protein [Anaerococcus faecalis]
MEIYSTDSEIISHNLVLLEDNLNLFPPYQAIAFMREDTSKKHPDLVKSLEKLSYKITNEQMQEMNYRVDVKRERASDVSKEFLEENNILD